MSHTTELYSGSHLLPEILFITSYPPRECGIATYSQDLIRVLNYEFSRSFQIRVCPLESESETHIYGDDTKYLLNVDQPDGFTNLAQSINEDDNDARVVTGNVGVESTLDSGSSANASKTA